MSDEKGRAELSAALPGLVPPWAGEKGSAQGSGVPLLPWIAVDRYHPVGRLDRDTTGLLLMSCEGKLTNRLLNPVKEVPRRYVAVVDGDVEASGSGDGSGVGLAEQLRAGVRTS